jgi:LysM repeat protein
LDATDHAAEFVKIFGKQIAAAYGVSIRKIIDANDIPDPERLRVGQVLQIPDS